MFKKLTLLLFLASAFQANAQFTIDDDTLYAYGYAGTSPSDFVDIYAHTMIRSTSGLGETIKWNRMVNALPDTNWHSAVCDIISCRDTNISVDSFLFSAGDSGVLSFHFYVKNINANGKMVVRFSRANDPLDYKDVVILAQAWKPVGIRENRISVSKLYPNPAKSTIQIINPEIAQGKLEIYNAMGQLVLQVEYTSGQEIDLSALNSGVFTVKYSNDNAESYTQFIKE